MRGIDLRVERTKCLSRRRMGERSCLVRLRGGQTCRTQLGDHAHDLLLQRQQTFTIRAFLRGREFVVLGVGVRVGLQSVRVALFEQVLLIEHVTNEGISLCTVQRFTNL